MKKLTATVSIILLLLITGCSSSWYVKRDIKKLEGLSLQYPNEFASLSDKLNPCFKAAAKSDTVVRTTTDTVTNSMERLIPGQPGKPDTLYLPGKTIKNNIYSTIHDTVQDSRALSLCTIEGKTVSDSLIIVETQSTQLRAEKSGLIKWVISLGVLLLTIIGVSIYKFFSGGALIDAAKKVI
jgi:hypothetical protein